MHEGVGERNESMWVGKREKEERVKRESVRNKLNWRDGEKG